MNSTRDNTYAHIAARIRGQGGPVQYVFDEPVITYVHPMALGNPRRTLMPGNY